jgi:hypothetical protein
MHYYDGLRRADWVQFPGQDICQFLTVQAGCADSQAASSIATSALCGLDGKLYAYRHQVPRDEVMR